MKKLLFLLALCCAAVACESTPDYMKADIEKNVSDGWYKLKGIQGLVYSDGKVDSLTRMSIWNGMITSIYYKVEDMQLSGYRYVECPRCGEKVTSTFSISYDLKNKVIEGNDILRFNEDEIILIEPMQRAIEHYESDKNFVRTYTTYKRSAQTDEITYLLNNAIDSEEENLQFALTHIYSNCKQQ